MQFGLGRSTPLEWQHWSVRDQPEAMPSSDDFRADVPRWE